MKIEKILQERGLKKEGLPIKLRRKIAQLEKLSAEVQEMVDEESDDPVNISTLEVAKVRLNDLDEALSKEIKNFNLETYSQRKERMKKINQSKTKKSVNSLPKEEETEQVFEETELELEKIPPISKTLHIKEDIDKLRESVEIKPESFEVEEDLEVEPVEPEIEEFEKEGVAKPKKMSKGLILMGVGAFLLTWGAVNFFRERRG